ncbi:hypothetical protein OESDEN_14545 [Oesophagostomum dentatum]|uniref:GDT1 family protein n=1 Tax=Oesophagostomum dentatum TaxID=61180 RepID=A0A0B1SPB7_OESDE|nr:hypothetical protein OESDEN_14545 [Oesophagostomum dentatum]
MAMRHSRLTVFSSAMTALALMTVSSACLHWVTQLIPREVTYYISAALFALFGLKMLHEGYHMSASAGQASASIPFFGFRGFSSVISSVSCYAQV